MWIWDFTPDFQRGKVGLLPLKLCARLLLVRYCGSHRPEGGEREPEHKASGFSQATRG